MPCYHPIRAWTPKNFKNPETGKKLLRFDMPIDLSRYEELQVPCGQCIGCRLDYSRDWATRICLEAKDWDENYFLTLTYAPEHVPIKAVVNTETGEYVEGLTLIPEHITKFMKDLRRYWQYHFGHDNIRFYACGEYGERTQRPHYHLCVFNLPMPDGALVPFFINALHQQIYLCPIIEKIWNKGQVSVGAVTWDSAAYVARYMLKKQKGLDSDEYYASKAQNPEFSRMSRKPGIGRAFYEGNSSSIYEHDKIVLAGPSGGREVRPPKYYDSLYDLDHPDVMERIKEQRKQKAVAAVELVKLNTDVRGQDYLDIKERAHIERIKKLPRMLD